VRCPPQNRGAGRLVALAVAGGVAALILFVVGVAVLMGRLLQPAVITGWTTPDGGRLHDPAQEACVMFQRWAPTAGYNGHISKTLPGDVRLLRRAIAEVDRSRLVRPQSRQRLVLSTDLKVLLHRVQEDTSPSDFIALAYEQSIGNDCALIGRPRPRGFHQAQRPPGIPQPQGPCSAGARRARPEITKGAARPGRPAGTDRPDRGLSGVRVW
jgi:hypothetical protein